MPKSKRTTKETAFTLLKGDHDKVKRLFTRFEGANPDEKQDIANEALEELKVHAAVEEQLLYPALRQEMEDEDGLMDEADEEHHVAKFLIAELEQMEGNEDHWEAKFTVLAENVRHHIKEEEGEIFPKARQTDIDFVVLGDQMAKLKKSLLEQGVPKDSEAEMVSKSGLRGDSPAKKAQRNLQVPMKAA
jgi:hemerythrin-like domain-containing protein